MNALEWTAVFTRDEHGKVTVGLYEEHEDGRVSFIAAEEFGPFCTALDVSQWLVRHWAPRARLPLR